MTESMIKFCKKDDGKIAIGTGIRPIEYCRAHYIEVYGPEFQAWNVIIPHREMGIEPEQMGIACAKTGEAVPAGTVWLDPVETHIPALVYGGLIEAIPQAEPTKAAKPVRTTEA